MNPDRIKERLLQSKAELEARLQRTHEHLYQRQEPVSANFSEQIKETENDPVVRTLDEEAQEELRLVSRALKRLYEGDYLICSRCGNPIGTQRLLAIPYADSCIHCAGKI